MQREQIAQLGGKTFGMLKVLNTQRTTSNFVLISRTDTTPRRTNLLGATLLTCRLASYIQRSVKRQDKWACFAHTQTRTDLNTRLFQAFNFFEKLGSRKHHTIADIALHTSPHDSTGDQVQSGLHPIDHQSMTCVVSPLKAHYALGAFSQPINELPLAFVTPLGTDHNYVTTFGIFHLKPDSIVKYIKWRARSSALRSAPVRDRSKIRPRHFHDQATHTPQFHLGAAVQLRLRRHPEFHPKVLE